LTTPKSKPRLPANLQSQIGLQLRLAQLNVSADLAEGLKDLQLRPVDFTTLALIEACPGLRQHVIGDRLQIARPNLVTLVGALQARGLVERLVDQADRRASQLRLTEAGQALLEQARKVEAGHLDRVMRALDGVDAGHLLKGLQQLARLGQN
jgi:DNA-binding MarR family transcriptional regulator